MSDVFAQATAYGVLPVIAIEDATHAIALPPMRWRRGDCRSPR